MADKPKCSICHERDVFSKGLCSGCYGRQWREQRKAERATQVPAQLTTGDADVIEGEVVDVSRETLPSTHLVARNPVEMEAARGDMKAWLEQKLSVLERDIIEANAALNEARKNGWATAALTSARNRAVDDETYYNKILAAVEAGHTIIPEFPISVFAVRLGEPDKRDSAIFSGATNGAHTYLGQPVKTDCAPAGAGKYRNPEPETSAHVYENKAPGAQERGESRWHTLVRRTGRPAGPISFPAQTARSPIMQATAKAMEDKVFDQFGVCFPVFATQGTRQVQTNAARPGDPLVIGQVVHKRVGSRQKCVSFIIAWHLNLNEL